MLGIRTYLHARIYIETEKVGNKAIIVNKINIQFMSLTKGPKCSAPICPPAAGYFAKHHRRAGVGGRNGTAKYIRQQDPWWSVASRKKKQQQTENEKKTHNGINGPSETFNKRCLWVFYAIVHRWLWKRPIRYAESPCGHLRGLKQWTLGAQPQNSYRTTDVWLWTVVRSRIWRFYRDLTHFSLFST